MKDYLLALVSVSISAGLLTLVLLGIRFILKKTSAPKKWIAAFWAFLAIRLMIPASVSLPVSLLPDPMEWLKKRAAVQESAPNDGQIASDTPSAGDAAGHAPASAAVSEPASAAESYVQTGLTPSEIVRPGESEADPAAKLSGNPVIPVNSEVAAASDLYPAGPANAQTVPPEPASHPLDVYSLLMILYGTGVAGMLVYFAVSCALLQRRVRQAIPMEGRKNAFLSDRIRMPFVFGPIRKRIYLPIDTPPEYMEAVLQHEEAHIQRRDPFWKLLGFLLLAVYWFNPFVWIAFGFFVKDIELASDERAIRTAGEAERERYAKALLFFSGNRTSPVLCQVAFGEVDLKERIRALKPTKKHAAIISFLALLLALSVSACLFTRPEESEPAREQTDSGSDLPQESADLETNPTKESAVDYREPLLPGTVFEEGKIPEQRRLADLPRKSVKIRSYTLAEDSEVQEICLPGYRSVHLLGQTKNAYCVSALPEQDLNRFFVLFLSKEDGSILKSIPTQEENGLWQTSQIELLESGEVLLKQFIPVPVAKSGQMPRQRRIGFLNDDGTVTELYCYEEKNDRFASSYLGVVGSKLFYYTAEQIQDADPEGGKDPQGAALIRYEKAFKMMDIHTHEIITIRTDLIEITEEGKTVKWADYFPSAMDPAEPDGFFYTVKEERPDQEVSFVGFDSQIQRTLYYYSFKTQTSSPILTADTREYYDQERDLYFTEGDPFWTSVWGDLNMVFMYGGYPNDPGFFSCIDLQNGSVYEIDVDTRGRYERDEANYIYDVRRTGEDLYLITTRWAIWEADTAAQDYKCYRMPSGDPWSEPYQRMTMVDIQRKMALRYRVEGDESSLCFYDLGQAVAAQ